MIRAKTSSVIIHLAAWLLFMSFPVIFMNQGAEGAKGMLNIFSAPYILYCVVYVAIFYLNAYYLFPGLYFKKRYPAYAVAVTALLLIVLSIKPFDRLITLNQSPVQMHMEPQPPAMHRPEQAPPQGPPPHNRGYRFDLNSLLIFIMVMGIGVALRTIKEWQLTEKRAILAEAERANAELSFLKAQINPHFLYNTLNNIYTLCITGSERAAESIMKLSDIMRYVTDEADANFVPLQGEIDCIGNFIDLQQLRLGKKVQLSYKVSGDTAGHQISPLILMTFIENVFKYGLSNHTPTQITIAITIEKSKITFYSQNSIFERSKPAERTGLGISNTRQRLAHLYPGKHDLVIDDQNNLFTVNLVLNS